MNKILLKVALVLLATAIFHPAHATEPEPGDGCVGFNENSIMRSGGPELGGVYHTLKCVSGSWVAIDGGSGSGGGSDTTPDAFAFTDVTEAQTFTTVTSNTIQIQGINAVTTITISGSGTPQWRSCSDALCSTTIQAWTSSAGGLANGQYFQLRLTSSAAGQTTQSANVLLGGSVSDEWSVRTGGRIVFVTSSTYGGNLGGVSGADAACNTRATAASLPGVYKAWISTNASDDPESRFTQYAGNYYAPNGVLIIANSWSDLTDGTLDNLINRTESGTVVSSQTVWTNVLQNGTFNDDACNNWSNATNLYYGETGTNSVTTTAWTNNNRLQCGSGSYRLYCFQQ